MMIGGSNKVVQVQWAINPFRGDRFEELWLPYAEAALDYGASAWAFMRSQQDQLIFTQLAWFDDKVDFERYWNSEELSEGRVRAAGLFQVPVLPHWKGVVGMGVRTEEPIIET